MNAICNYDFTISCEHTTRETLEKIIRNNCKKWGYQREKGNKTGYEHYQGRVSLKIKTRLAGVIKTFSELKGHWSITSNENKDNMFYVFKEETRIEGPWTDKDEIIYIPRQIKEIESLYPWQQHIYDHTDDWDTRSINCVIDNEGCIGKSIIVTKLAVEKKARKIPPLNDIKDIMRIVMDVETSRCYLIDMPRAMNKDRLYQFYAGIETLKDGYAYDDRYHFKDKHFDCPNIWIFSNKKPDIEMLSKDRWIFWKVIGNKLAKIKMAN